MDQWAARTLDLNPHHSVFRSWKHVLEHGKGEQMNATFVGRSQSRKHGIENMEVSLLGQGEERWDLRSGIQSRRIVGGCGALGMPLL